MSFLPGAPGGPVVGVVWYSALIIALGETTEQEVGAGLIHGDRDIPEDGDTQECFDVRIVRLGGEGIPEEDEEVEALLGDLCADLEIAA